MNLPYLVCRMSEYVSSILIFLFLLSLMVSCRRYKYDLVTIHNRYVNNSGHDIKFIPYIKQNSIWYATDKFNLNIRNERTEYIYIREAGKTISSVKDVLIDGIVDSVTIDYGHGVQATFKPLVEEPVKRNIYNEKYYVKRIIQDNEIEYEVVLTFTFTEQDYLDAQ